MKKTLAVAVAIVFVLGLAAAVFAAGSMNHSTEYHMDGDIDITKQVGHLCNTGAEMKQVVEGEGEMTKVMDTNQVRGVLTVADDQDWVTAEDAVRNLTVTSAIELCAPPKTEYTSTEHVYLEADGDFPGWWFSDATTGELTPAMYYQGEEAESTLMDQIIDDAIAGDLSADQLELFADGASAFEILQVEGSDEFSSVTHNELTDQIWAAQVEADPGYSGGLSQDFEAAYGPYYGDHIQELQGVADTFWFTDADGEYTDEYADKVGFASGEDYVGNYFNIDQFARTSQGTTQRYIDISSPWSGAYLHEDMTVVGTAEIDESFSMDNVAPGAEAVPDWWDLF